MSKGKTYSLFLDVEVMDKLEKFCKRNNMSKSSYINSILKDSLKTIDSLFSDENVKSATPKEAILLSGISALTEHLNELINLQKEFMSERSLNEKKINGKAIK